MCFRVKLVIKVRKFWTELFLISKLVLKISVQSDETTDVENCRQMIALVRSRAWLYHNNRFLILWRYEKNHQSKRHLLMSKRKLPNITWTSKLLVLCVLTVPLLCLEINKSGSFALLKQDIPQLEGTHCFLHRHTLALKTQHSKIKNSLIFLWRPSTELKVVLSITAILSRFVKITVEIHY